MDYQALINDTKDKLENYSFDDSAYAAIYEKAKLHLTNALREGNKDINVSLKDAQQNAVSENALATKSLQEQLAARGLAKSGESSLLMLNQQLSLSNALADLSGDASKAKGELYSSHQKELADIEADLSKQKSEAAKTEINALTNRLSDLEKMQADDEKWRAALYATSATSTSSGSPSNGNNSTDAKKDQETSFDANESYAGFIPSLYTTLMNKKDFTPSYSADKTANDIMLTCGATDGIIRSNYMQSKVYKELVRLIVTTDYSKEYAQNVISVLRSHGFAMDFDLELAKSKQLDVTNNIYQRNFRTLYATLLRSGFSQNEAASRAKNRAKALAESYVQSLNLSDSEYNEIMEMLWMIN